MKESVCERKCVCERERESVCVRNSEREANKGVRKLVTSGCIY